ncbi:MAG: amidohydrolase family protein [Saprospiraceae bacterium]|nr:amidohydrolase family protein [Saprospiraceae bacterium]
MKLLHRGALVALSAFASFSAFSQGTYPQPAPSDQRSGAFAFTHATIYKSWNLKLDDATLLIRNGKVEACGIGISVPADAVVTDCAGKTIYPGFIDLYAAGYGLPEPRPAGPAGRQQPQMMSNKKGAFAWNEALKPEYRAAEAFVNNPKSAKSLRTLGFTTVLTHQADGISRGTAALVALSDKREAETLLAPDAAHVLSFRKGVSTQSYPSSLMGCIALIRQTCLDGQWYAATGRFEERNLSLEAWNNVQALPQLFEAEDKLDILRIHQIAREFDLRYIVKTQGDEYQRLDAVKATGFPLIVPVNFPEAYDLRDPYAARQVALRELMHWEQAPANPGRLEKAGIPFAITAHGLKDPKQFFPNLRKAIAQGLSEGQALRALTAEPARLIGAENLAGSLEPGRAANFIVASGNIFDEKTHIRQTWVLGKAYDAEPEPTDGVDLRGQYLLRVGAERYPLTVEGKPEAPEATLLRADSSKVKADLQYQNGLLLLTFAPDTTTKTVVSLRGEVSDSTWTGQAALPDGAWTTWSATRTATTGGPADQPVPPKSPDQPVSASPVYPFTAFGWTEKPTPQTVLIRNATVWTNEKDGILPNTDVLIRDGKISQVGKGLPAPSGATEVDGTGKHLTAGIIDEHSHIAVARNVNEGTQESSAEVRIGDALDSEDIDIYRQLAGGVTASHLLHGSANPIGGQTQLIKLRWGAAPEALKFDRWPGQIKFALGENVKQSNWGDNNRTRYPQTRMGVEQVFIDYFTRAREYASAKKSGKPYRQDLEMDALLEILEKKRFITCHSYVQSEIVMLMRVAEQFGFTVNTFTHILEGYKVADKMAAHGAGGSTFSDWWNYKMEVQEAIPYNAKMMHDRGVTVAINSDDAEMARRLNQEAAKAVAYGGTTEEDAWKMVTLNPARLLHVDDRVGSIRAGKDADVVLWTGHPLSVYTRAEKTWVDGVLYFDLMRDAELRAQVQAERARLVQKMLAGKKIGGGAPKPGREKKYYHCDSNADEG